MVLGGDFIGYGRIGHIIDRDILGNSGKNIMGKEKSFSNLLFFVW
jgi:hypothetical protein